MKYIYAIDVDNMHSYRMIHQGKDGFCACGERRAD